MTMQEHWESIYTSKSEADMSWTQPDASPSLALIGKVCRRGAVIDVGSGTSILPKALLDRGYSVTVLDISQQALNRAKERLGEDAARIRWMPADVTAHPDLGRFDVWHDRAVFHFLASDADRRSYRDLLLRTVLKGGHVIIATFALDGPEKCSGLEVVRYSSNTLATELGSPFRLVEDILQTHETPWGTQQKFQYSVFQVTG